MNRVERRRQQKAKKRKTYTLTQTEIDKLKNDAVEQVMTLLLAILCRVLLTDYWLKTAEKKRLPKFFGKVVDLYRD